ncbi:type VI secretion system-associated protein TagF [Photobacterium sanctipauli]|uniref:Type VI secretion system-associated protein TagF n=1 Tax=Photobacterium sanctipauli TaxID=1342794 RepID=A0A2T3NU53_9GAMM|nr:type VI secretion system-associated protein TagF [Photobacterium sanctipauli]PSW19783.1 type VI secretion system-associated protein TagF [Photobacterium sanctipauli]
MIDGNWSFGGKIPTHSDFLSHNEPLQLQESLRLTFDSIAINVALKKEWNNAYRDMSVWCFNLPVQVTLCGDYCGCIIASYDAVGRCYPFYVFSPGLFHPSKDNKLIRKVYRLMQQLKDGELTLEEFTDELNRLPIPSQTKEGDISAYWWNDSGSSFSSISWPNSEQIRLMVGVL